MSSKEPSYLTVDAGTGGLKCIVFDRRGSIVFKETRPIDLVFDGPAIEFDTIKVWNDACAMIRRAVESSEKKMMQIKAISSTSMREGNVFYDGTGRELLAVPNLDARAFRESLEIQGSLGDLIYEKSGHWPSAIFLICRLIWLRSNRPELYSKIAKVSMINDWILFKFSGKLASEPTNGCETAIFDLRKRDWSAEIIKEAGLDASIFPSVKECGAELGGISEDTARATGLATSTRVIVGAADTEAAVAGCGVFDEGDVVSVAGTTTPVQAVTDSVVLDAERRTWSCCHTVPDKWVVESNAGATGLVFKWWSELVGKEFSFLDNEVADSDGGKKSNFAKVEVSIGTNLMNAKNPHPLAGMIQGVGPWTPRADITRAILESNCFSVRANLEQLEVILQRKFPEVYFCGGSSSSDLWTRLQGNILGRRIIKFSTGEASGRGAAMLCSVGTGEYANLREASQSFLPGRELIEPNKDSALKYQKEYENWTKKLPRNLPT